MHSKWYKSAICGKKLNINRSERHWMNATAANAPADAAAVSGERVTEEEKEELKKNPPTDNDDNQRVVRNG